VPALLTLSLILVLALTVFPILVLLLTSFRPRGTYGFDQSAFTFLNYLDLLQQREVLVLVTNTFTYVSGTIVMGVALAGVWAWVTERTDFKFKATVRVLMLLTFALPSLVQGLGWTLLLNPSNGLINLWTRALLGLDAGQGPFNIYSMAAMVFVSGFLLTPPVYVMLAGVIRHLDYKLEFPAVLAGVPPRIVFSRIIVPILLPGLLSVLIYTVMLMIQVFDIPLSIGLTAGIQVFSTRIYLLSSSDMGAPNYNLAAAWGVVLVFTAVGLVALYRRLTRLSEKFAVISGKSYSLVRTRLGKRRYAAYAFGALFFLMALSPSLILAWTSLLPFYDAPSLESLQKVSLKNYADLFDSSMFRRGLLNTTVMVLAGATLTMALSFIVSYTTFRPVGHLRKFIDTMAFLPIGIPQIVLGLAVLLLYVRTPIYGTIIVIVLAQMSINMVFAIRALSAGLLQVDRNIERAAEVSGVSRLNIMGRIMAPIIKTQFFNAWLLVFAYSVRDIGIPLIFLTSETVVLGSALWLLWGYPNVPGAAALSVLLIVFLAVFITPLQLYVSRITDEASA
jgi:iron(III) transport system permease protein